MNRALVAPTQGERDQVSTAKPSTKLTGREAVRQKIIEALDLTIESIDVPEWGVKLQIRGMDGLTRARMLRECLDAETNQMDFEKLYPALLIATAYDPDSGEPVFQVDDVGVINSKSGAVLEKVAGVAMKVSGMDAEAQERGKAASSTAQSDVSTSS